MAINTGFPQQQPLAFTAAVRPTPSPQHAGRLDIRDEPTPPSTKAPHAAEEKSFDPRPRR